MFDDDEPSSEKASDAVKSRRKQRLQPVNWDLLSEAELLACHDEILKRLPPTKLSEMNLEHELLIQFYTLRGLQSEVMDDDTVPVNQRAQVGNAVGSILNRMTELQNKLYESETFKMLEGAMIRQMKKLPEELAEKFLAEYEEIVSRRE